MKFAPVSSPAFLDVVQGAEYHMALAHLVLTNGDYAEFYRRESDRGAFVILDNGIWEDELLPASKIRQAADMIQATEVILPDVLRNGSATFQAVEAALPYFASYQGRLAVVVQGDAPATIWEFLGRFLGCHHRWGVSTLMFPKHFEEFMGSRMDMLTKVLAMRLLAPSIDYHALGFETMMWQNLKIAQRFPQIRSIDSASPLASACKGVLLPQQTKTSSRFMWNYNPKEHDHEMVRSFARRNVAFTIEQFENA
jgi:hypothetical protein